jgi:hypothetical protein
VALKKYRNETRLKQEDDCEVAVSAEGCMIKLEAFDTSAANHGPC